MRKILLPLPLTVLAALNAAVPDIVVNNSTGSDTLASGAPSSITAVNGSCDTNGVASATIDVTFSTATIPTDGGAAVWINTAAATRHWSRITAKTATTITVEETFNIADAAPLSCAVGGKRATFSSNRTCQDMKVMPGGEATGWRLSIEDTGTNYAISAAVDCVSSNSERLIRGTGSTRPIVEATHNGTSLLPRGANLEFLHFTNTSVAKGSAIALDLTSHVDGYIRNSIFGGSSIAESFDRAVTLGTGTPQGTTITQCEFRFNNTAFVGAVFLKVFAWNYIHDNTTGILMDNSGIISRGLIWRNLIVNNTGDGIRITGQTGTATGMMTAIIENTIDGNGGDGIDLAGVAAGKTIYNNQITNNALFGVTCTAATQGCGTDAIARSNGGIVDFNNFFNNTSGARNNFQVGPSDSAVDPGYVSRAGFNWCPSSTGNRGGPPGGAGTVYRGTMTGSFILRGACQRSGGAGINIGI